MATRRGWLATIQWGMLLCASALLAVSTASELLQEGLTKETAEGDLQAAIVIYEKIVAQHADDASVAADAQLHIGMCYEKLGRQEARAAYEDVIALFPDEKQVVALATERLQALQEADELGQQQAGAGPEKTRQMIDRLGQRLADVSSYRGSLAVSLELMGKEIHSQGPMWFQRPNLSRIELTSSLPTGNTISIVDGSTSWSYQTAGNIVGVMDLAALAQEFPERDMTKNAVFRPLEGFDDASLRYLRTDRIDGVEVYVFQGKQDGVAAQMGFGQATPDWLEVAIGADDGLLRSLIAYRESGVVMMTTQAQIHELNVSLPDSLFVFTPPDGMQTMDMTETVRTMLAKVATSEAAESDHPEAAGMTGAGAVIEALEAARKKVTSYRAEASREMHMMGTVMTYNSKEWHGESGQSRMEMTSSMAPGTTITMGDSLEMWTYMPAMKMAQRIDRKRMEEAMPEEDDEDKPSTFHGMLSDGIIYLGEESLSGDDVQLLEGPAAEIPKGLAMPAPGKIKVWIGVHDGIVRRKISYDQQGKEILNETRTQVEINIDIPDSTFTFTPADGLQVMDMTENVINQVRTMRAAQATAADEPE